MNPAIPVLKPALSFIQGELEIEGLNQDVGEAASCSPTVGLCLGRGVSLTGWRAARAGPGSLLGKEGRKKAPMGKYALPKSAHFDDEKVGGHLLQPRNTQPFFPGDLPRCCF